MTSKIIVSLKQNSYAIIAGHGIFKDLPKYLRPLGLGLDAVVISHPSLERLYGKILAQVLSKFGLSVKFFNVPQGEQSKSAACAMALLERIAAYDVDRKIFVVALGGGVVGDLAGFVAAMYKRGVPYIQVPTTLLAQVDSAIGGKTGIDLKAGKNLAGAFHQPKLVFSDASVLKTLDRRQIRNGLAEAVKYGIIHDPKLFAFLEANASKLLQADAEILGQVVKRCAKIKAEVVAADEKETKGLRTILNFGHTVGHAVEAAGGYDRYYHGEAVGLGMRVATRISVLMGLLKPAQEQRINRLISSVGLPEKIQGMCLSAILNIMRHDKKFIAGRNRFVLATAIGKVKVVSDVPQSAILQAIQSCIK